MSLAQYYSKNVIIHTDIGTMFRGSVTDYIYPDENENEKESIIILCADGSLVEFYEEDISSIEITDAKKDKILVIGCPGSGKSTFSTKLGEYYDIPVTHLDRLYWNKDGSHVSREALEEQIDKAMTAERWILDGNYLSTLEKRLSQCDTVFFLDYSVEQCLEGVRDRKGQRRPDSPLVEKGENPDLTAKIRAFPEKEKPVIEELLKKYSDKTIIRFKTRAESEKWFSERS